MSMYKRRAWREICEELLLESNRNRRNELLEELLDALEEHARTHGPENLSPGAER